ncbi:MAG: hypothetical protein AB2L21_06680 [Anaerolineaceae bacterium]
MNEQPPVESTVMPNGGMQSTWSNNRKWISIVIMLLITVVAIVLSNNYDFAVVEAFLQQNPSWTITISLAVYLMLGFTVIPCIPLTVFLAYTLDPLTAILVNGTGMTLSSLVEYYTGKTINNIVDLNKLRSKMPEKFRNMPLEAPVFQLVGRLILPKPLGLISGAAHVPLKTYLWTSFLINTVGGIVVSFGGLGIINLFSR